MQSVLYLASMVGLVVAGCKFYIFYKNNEDNITLVRNILFSSGNVKAEPFSVAPYGKYATVTYDRVGTKSTIVVPYNRSATVAMAQYKAYLHTDNGEQIDITQQPGIPYVCPAGLLGGKSIMLLNNATCMTHMYDAHSAPMYGTELAYEE